MFYEISTSLLRYTVRVIICSHDELRSHTEYNISRMRVRSHPVLLYGVFYLCYISIIPGTCRNTRTCVFTSSPVSSGRRRLRHAGIADNVRITVQSDELGAYLGVACVRCRLTANGKRSRIQEWLELRHRLSAHEHMYLWLRFRLHYSCSSTF